jgi:AcrR family transcriptional regulator
MNLTPTQQRIMAAARELFFARGYASVHMDDIAHELGMSKKTLYLHFRSKDTLLCGICRQLNEECTHMRQTTFKDLSLPLLARHSRYLEYVTQKLSRLHPSFFAEVKRHAPAVYQEMMDLRRKSVVETVSTMITEGQQQGLIRPEVNPAFAVEAYQTVVMHCLQPECLEACGVALPQACRAVSNLFFQGLLTDEGRRAGQPAELESIQAA